MPYTAADLGVDPNDPAENLDGCVRYLAQNLDAWAHTDDPIALALASYNAGPGAVSSYGGIPPYEETQHYVAIITSRYQWLLNENLASASEVYG
jgi:soluble lytic murein transglycosylase-like protein